MSDKQKRNAIRSYVVGFMNSLYIQNVQHAKYYMACWDDTRGKRGDFYGSFEFDLERQDDYDYIVDLKTLRFIK